MKDSVYLQSIWLARLDKDIARVKRVRDGSSSKPEAFELSAEEFRSKVIALL